MNIDTDDRQMPAAIDPTATYMHNGEDGFTGVVEDWAEDPDGSLKVRIKDHWVFFKDLTRADHAEAEEPDGETT